MLKTCALAIFAMTACISLTLAQGPEKAFDFYPLKVGNRWTYVATDLKGGQAKADKKQKVVVEVVREETYIENLLVDGKMVQEKHKGFVLKSISGGKTSDDFVLFTEKGLDILEKDAKAKDATARSKGLHRIHTAGTPITPPLKILSYPYIRVDEWTANSTSGNTVMKGTSKAQQQDVKDRTQDVKVPFGVFPGALHVAYRDHQKADLRIEIDYWFANHVGMVKQRVLSKDHEILLELEKFEPAK